MSEQAPSSAPPAAMSVVSAPAHEPARHLYFDDRAAVPWYHALSAALEQAALPADKPLRVLVVFSRLDCGGSRALIERVFAKEEISEELRARFLCVCIDTRHLEAHPQAQALFQSLPKREPTPVCMYLTPDARIVHSTAGGRPAAVFLRDLTEAFSRR